MQIQNYNIERVNARQVDELIGILKGVAADGIIMFEEVNFLIKWMHANPLTPNQFPANVIYPRLIAAISDGKIDVEEEREILDLLLKATGNNTAQNTNQSSNSSQLPLCNPPPVVTIKDRMFCFTGKFYAGKRTWCEQQIIDNGGLVSKKSITKDLDYLVIGEIGTPDWLHSTHGLKIEAAIDYRNKHQKIAIISEAHWLTQMDALIQ